MHETEDFYLGIALLPKRAIARITPKCIPHKHMQLAILRYKVYSGHINLFPMKCTNYLRHS